MDKNKYYIELLGDNTILGAEKIRILQPNFATRKLRKIDDYYYLFYDDVNKPNLLGFDSKQDAEKALNKLIYLKKLDDSCLYTTRIIKGE